MEKPTSNKWIYISVILNLALVILIVAIIYIKNLKISTLLTKELKTEQVATEKKIEAQTGLIESNNSTHLGKQAHKVKKATELKKTTNYETPESIPAAPNAMLDSLWNAQPD